MNVVLISTYDLGHQPFGLASPSTWLKHLGASITTLDLAVQPLQEQAIAGADLVAFHVPMHTATRIAAVVIPRVKAINPGAHLCVYGLYAAVNEAYLRTRGVDTILGGEFEEGLTDLVQRLAANREFRPGAPQREPIISLARQSFLVPDRSGLPALSHYAHLKLPGGECQVVGYTEASRGCKHFCRHCPIVPVYEGIFRVVQKEVVLEDIRQQAEAGARHITFGDPDFFNGPGHATAIIRDFHREFPQLTYDVTIKIEHLLKHARLLPVLRDTGCLFVTSAVESFDDHILEIFDKRHTRDDFRQVVALFRETGLVLNPTFVTFTPWTSRAVYQDLLSELLDLDLVENVSPIQYAIRLLIPQGSKLLELAEARQFVGPFNQAALCYSWAHPDPQVDRLYDDVLAVVRRGQRENKARRDIFLEVWQKANRENGKASEPFRAPQLEHLLARAATPQLTEPWFC